MNWRLLLHPGLPGAANMAIDEALFLVRQSDLDTSIAVLYMAAPTLSLGFFQDLQKGCVGGLLCA